MNQPTRSGLIGNGFRYAALPLVFAIIVFAALWFFYPQEYLASDPGAYSLNAFRISQGTYWGAATNHPFDHRIGVSLPVALAYKLFGVSLLSTNLLPLLACLIIFAVIWLALPTPTAKILGLVFCILNVVFFTQSVYLFPDIIATAFMLLSSLFLWQRKKSIEGNARDRFLPLFAITALFIAFLAKESAYWVLPLWAYYFFADVREKNTQLLKSFYLPALAIGAVLGISYLAFCAWAWGDPLARIRSVQGLADAHLWNWDGAPLNDKLNRLTIQPLRIFFVDFGIISPLALLSLFVIPKPYRFWAFYTLSTVLLFWFGSASLTSYEPLPPWSRMAMPAFPGLVILASYLGSQLTVSASRSPKFNAVIVVMFFIAILAPSFIDSVASWQSLKRPEAEAIALVRRAVTDNRQENFLLVTSDSRSPSSLQFYFGYNYPSNLRVVYAGDLTQDQLLRSTQVFLYINQDLSTLMRRAYHSKNYDAEIQALDLTIVYDETKFLLFKADAPADVTALLQSKP